MARLFVAALVSVVVLAPDLAAAEIRGKLKGVDPAKASITLDVNGKDRTFTVSKDAAMTVQDIRSYQPENGLKDPVFRRKGLLVVLKTAKKDGKEVVTQIMIYTGRKG